MEATTNTFTAQQQTAIRTRDVSVVLSSGAGCGKTHVLTQRYVSHLKNDDATVSEIVAITFTDRAAREMRARIRSAIVQEQQHDPSGPWGKHLRDLESAAIATIHSFCGNLLRQFAVPAGLDPQFDVLNPVLAENIQREALRETLERLLTSSEPAGKDLGELVVLYGWGMVQRTVAALLEERDPAAWHAWLLRTPSDIAHAWQTTHLEALRSGWLEYLGAAGAPITHLVRLFEATPCLLPLTQNNVTTVLHGLPQLAHTTDLAATIEQLCEAAKVVTKEKGKAWPDEASYRRIQEAMKNFREYLPQQFALFTEDAGDVTKAAQVGQWFLRVAFAVVDDFQQRKTRLGVLDFQDMLVLARDLLRDSPTVQQTLQERYRYLLLDEMQDTDPVQMEFVKLLCGDGLPTGKLFAVGDQKQSIYRFRGADVTLFEELRTTMPTAGQQHLTLNFRSQPNILTFVNALCRRRMPHYEGLQPHRMATATQECVEFLWTIAEVDSHYTVGDLREHEAHNIAQRIAELLVEPTEERAGPIRLGDIVLLFRSMSNVATYENALRQRGLDYYLVGGRAFYAQQEIYDVLNLLRTLENPMDSICLAGVLRAPWANLSDDTLFLLGSHRGGMWAGLHDLATLDLLPAEQRPAAERIRTLLQAWRANKDRLSLAQLLTQAITDTGYDAALQFEFLGERKLANLWKMIELARAFDRSGSFGLPEFIARLDELIAAQPREEQAATQPENADVIKIMSIHQAKGLEFPIVFVPDLATTTRRGSLVAARWDRVLGCIPKPPDEDPPLLVEFPQRLSNAYEEVAEWREDLRILYVACTRPRERLILSASFKEPFPTDGPPDQPVPVKGANTWMAALGEQFHLQSGVCLDRTIAEAERPTARVRLMGTTPSASKPTPHAEHPTPTWHAADFTPIPAVPLPPLLPAAELFRHVVPAPSRELLNAWEQDDLFTQHESLEPLTGSAWPARWAKALQCHRGLPYVAPLSAIPQEREPLIQGTLDWLWQDENGWHLLLIDAGEQRDVLELQWQAFAVRTHLGEALQSATLFNLADGTTQTLTPLLLAGDACLSLLRQRLHATGTDAAGSDE